MKTQQIDVDVILLDQGETFMFGNDRFGREQDFAATYRNIGGALLSDAEVHDTISTTVEALLVAYDSGQADDRFPTVHDILAASTTLSETEMDFLDDVIAEHEVGTISSQHRETIHQLAETHRLGIISNVFAQPARFEHNLQQAGILGCFDHIVWSSAHGVIKPSPRIFHIAIEHWAIEPDRILYVGNDAKRDVGGSKGVGMKSAWINLHEAKRPPGIPEPEVTLNDLSELVLV